MRERLSKQLGNRVRGLTTGTFHAICGKLLRAEIAGRIGHYTADFTIYGADEQLQLAAGALDSAKERPPQLLEPDDLLRLISRNKSRGCVTIRGTAARTRWQRDNKTPGAAPTKT